MTHRTSIYHMSQDLWSYTILKEYKMELSKEQWSIILMTMTMMIIDCLYKAFNNIPTRCLRCLTLMMVCCFTIQLIRRILYASHIFWSISTARNSWTFTWKSTKISSSLCKILTPMNLWSTRRGILSPTKLTFPIRLFTFHHILSLFRSLISWIKSNIFTAKMPILLPDN